MNDFQSVMAGAADSGLSPWGESWSDHDVVVEFLNEKRNGKCYDFNSLCKYFVTQAYKINKSSIPDVTPYIREQLDKIAKYKTVSAKMCLLRDILYQIDVYIVQNGRFYPTNENIYIDEIKTVDFGFVAGAGFTVIPKLDVTLRFVIGLTDMIDDMGLGSKNLRAQLGVTYWFM